MVSCPLRAATNRQRPRLRELPNFSADMRVQVGDVAVVNPVERDAVRGELERPIGGDALQAGFKVPKVDVSVPNRRAI